VKGSSGQTAFFFVLSIDYIYLTRRHQNQFLPSYKSVPKFMEKRFSLPLHHGKEIKKPFGNKTM
jgi:hypothetical protein